MKKGKRVKPKFPIEYRVLMMPKYKEREKEIVTFVALRTVNEFTNFRYEIVVTSEVQDHVIQLNIHGLRAPQVMLPGTGPAISTLEFRNLSGLYEVVISKLDREVNSFCVHNSDKAIIVKKIPKKKFVEIVTNEEDW